MGYLSAIFGGTLAVQSDLEAQKRKIAHMARQLANASSANNGLAALRKENEELRLYLAALIRLLESKGVFNPSEIKSAVFKLDREDGKISGGHSGKLV